MAKEETRALVKQRNEKARETVKGILRDDEMIHDVYYQYLMKRLTEPDGDKAEVIIRVKKTFLSKQILLLLYTERR
jgi:hypothetical protein